MLEFILFTVCVLIAMVVLSSTGGLQTIDLRGRNLLPTLNQGDFNNNIPAIDIDLSNDIGSYQYRNTLRSDRMYFRVYPENLVGGNYYWGTSDLYPKKLLDLETLKKQFATRENATDYDKIWFDADQLRAASLPITDNGAKLQGYQFRFSPMPVPSSTQEASADYLRPGGILLSPSGEWRLVNNGSLLQLSNVRTGVVSFSTPGSGPLRLFPSGQLTFGAWSSPYKEEVETIPGVYKETSTSNLWTNAFTTATLNQYVLSITNSGNMAVSNQDGVVVWSTLDSINAIYQTKDKLVSSNLKREINNPYFKKESTLFFGEGLISPNGQYLFGYTWSGKLGIIEKSTGKLLASEDIEGFPKLWLLGNGQMFIQSKHDFNQPKTFLGLLNQPLNYFNDKTVNSYALLLGNDAILRLVDTDKGVIVWRFG